MDAYTFALWTAAAVVLVLVVQRRLIFSWSAIGVFLIMNLVIIQIGVLGISIFREYAELRFSTFNLGLLTDEDLKLTIILNVWGAGIVLASYQLTHFALSGGNVLRKRSNLLALDPQIDRLGFQRNRLLLTSGTALVVALAYAAVNAPRIIVGVQGVLAGSQAGLLGARYDIGADYWFILIVFNVLPFLGVALRLAHRLQGGLGLRLFIVLFNTCTAALLLFTFQKRPLLVFLCALFLVNAVTARRRAPRNGKPAPAESTRRRRQGQGLVRLAAYGIMVFVVLLALYQLQTQTVSGGEDIQDLLEGLGTLTVMASATILGGQAVPAVLFAHYFPAIEPHYGLSNIGLLSKLLGFDLYRSTYAPYDYFVDFNYFVPFVDRIEGSLASAALMDFYGAFGLIGWVFGAIALGIALNRIDAAMASLRPDASRSLLAIFLFVSVYYLSNASVANTLAGYGGLIFVLLWLLLRVPLRPIVTPHVAVTS